MLFPHCVSLLPRVLVGPRTTAEATPQVAVCYLRNHGATGPTIHPVLRIILVAVRAAVGNLLGDGAPLLGVFVGALTGVAIGEVVFVRNSLARLQDELRALHRAPRGHPTEPGHTPEPAWACAGATCRGFDAAVSTRASANKGGPTAVHCGPGAAQRCPTDAGTCSGPRVATTTGFPGNQIVSR